MNDAQPEVCPWCGKPVAGTAEEARWEELVTEHGEEYDGVRELDARYCWAVVEGEPEGCPARPADMAAEVLRLRARVAELEAERAPAMPSCWQFGRQDAPEVDDEGV